MNAALRQQLTGAAAQGARPRQLTNSDRLFFIQLFAVSGIQLYRWFPASSRLMTIIRPETLVRLHRAGFRPYWRWNSEPGRPARIDASAGADPTG